MGLEGDLEHLVGRNHQRRRRAAGDHRGAGSVFVSSGANPKAEPSCHLGPDPGVVLPEAGGEAEGVDPDQEGGVAPHVEDDPVYVGP